MGAQILKAYGRPENFVLADIPKLAIRPPKLLIRVAAGSAGTFPALEAEHTPTARFVFNAEDVRGSSRRYLPRGLPERRPKS